MKFYFKTNEKQRAKTRFHKEGIATKARAAAKEKRVSIETLVNLWLKEKLSAVR